MMTIDSDEFDAAYRTKVPPQYLSCFDALVELGKTDPRCYEHTIPKLAAITGHDRRHINGLFKELRRLRNLK